MLTVTVQYNKYNMTFTYPYDLHLPKWYTGYGSYCWTNKAPGS